MEKMINRIVIVLCIIYKMFAYVSSSLLPMNNVINKVLFFTIIILSLYTLLNNEFNKKSFIFMIITLVLSLIMFFVNQGDNLIFYILIALVSKEFSDDKIVKYFFFGGLVCYIVIYLLGYTGFIKSTEVYRTIAHESVTRNSLGFANANAVFTTFVPITYALLYLITSKKVFIIYNIIFLLIAIYLFNESQSRTGFYMFIFTSLIYYLPKLKIINKYNFLHCFIITIAITLLFGQNKYNFVSTILSYRPYYFYFYLKEGIFMLGKGVIDNMVLDNFYLGLLSYYHIVGFIIYGIIYYYGTKLSDNYKLNLISFSFLVYGIFEYIVPFNFVIVLFYRKIINHLRGIEYEN